jgi:hypothetical protein
MLGNVKATPKIAKVSRCIFPGGKAVLMGYDRDGKEVFGIGVKPKSVVKWVMQGVQKGDVVRLMDAYVEWLQQQREGAG